MVIQMPKQISEMTDEEFNEMDIEELYDSENDPSYVDPFDLERSRMESMQEAFEADEEAAKEAMDDDSDLWNEWHS